MTQETWRLWMECCAVLWPDQPWKDVLKHIEAIEQSACVVDGAIVGDDGGSPYCSVQRASEFRYKRLCEVEDERDAAVSSATRALSTLRDTSLGSPAARIERALAILEGRDHG